MRDFRPAQLSTCTFFDLGTHGSMDGTYALKLATRPRRNHTATLIKRLTWQRRGLVQVEAYFTFKAEQTFGVAPPGGRPWDGNYHPSEAMFGAFDFANDVCEDAQSARYHCTLRYLNADADGRLVQTWMTKTSVQPTTKMVRAGGAVDGSDFQVLHPADWAEIPGGHQPLCTNEVPTKINWHYLRWRFDLAARRNVELQVHDRLMDLRAIEVPQYADRYTGLDRLLNFSVHVRTHMDVRNFLLLDSVLISVDW